MKLREHDLAVLAHHVDECGLKRGDVGTVVHEYAGQRAYEIEFVTMGGDTLVVLTLTDADVVPVDGSAIMHARPRS